MHTIYIYIYTYIERCIPPAGFPCHIPSSATNKQPLPLLREKNIDHDKPNKTASAKHIYNCDIISPAPGGEGPWYRRDPRQAQRALSKPKSLENQRNFKGAQLIPVIHWIAIWLVSCCGCCVELWCSSVLCCVGVL